MLDSRRLKDEEYGWKSRLFFISLFEVSPKEQKTQTHGLTELAFPPPPKDRMLAGWQVRFA